LSAPTGVLSRLPFFYGWWVVGACATIIFFSAGTFFYGFGLLVSPLTAEFGWSRASISLAFSLRTEVGGVAAPLVGFIVDRVGVRRLIIGGLFVVVAGFVFMSRIQSLWAFYGAVMLIAAGMSGTGGQTANVAIAQWFHRKRGRALGFMTFGGGMGGVLIIIFAWLIDSYGWRDALLILATIQFVVCVPLALSIRNRPQDMGLLPDGDLPVAPEAGGGATSRRAGSLTAGMTTREALRSSLFWQVAVGFALVNYALTSVIVHLVPFLEEGVGMSTGAAATAFTVMTAISLFGRLGMGIAADYLSKRLVMAICMVVLSVSLFLLATVHEVWQLAYVLPLFALGFGGVIPVRTTMQAEYFGLRQFGSIQGMMFAVATLGAFVGPVLAGWLYDVTGSYRLAFVLIGIGPIAGLPLILIARPRPFASETEPAAVTTS
jgi:sugar phosphate permease